MPDSDEPLDERVRQRYVGHRLHLLDLLYATIPPERGSRARFGTASGGRAAGAPGRHVVLKRLAEVVFVEALRRYVIQLPAERKGWLAGAADPALDG